MSDNTGDKIKKTLSLSKGSEVKKIVDAGQVRQSFSHGRSKTVTVEVKRRRSSAKVELAEPERALKVPPLETGVVAENPSLSPKTSRTLGGLTEKEWDARKQAVQGAVKAELERTKRVEDLAHQEAERRSTEETRRKIDEDLEAALVREHKARNKEIVDEPILEGAPSKHVSSTHLSPRDAPLEDHGDDDTADNDDTKKAKNDSRKSLSSHPRRDDLQRREGRLTLQQALVAKDNDNETGRMRSAAALKRAREKERLRHAQETTEAKRNVREVIIPEVITIQELANRMAVRGADIVKSLMKMGMMVTITQHIDGDTAELVVTEFGHQPKRVSEADVEIGLQGVEDAPELLRPRPPVVTVMGHVDHGKTSLLDALRSTDKAGSEAGGITQHIGAYQVELKSGQKISFIDTPGHAAFTEMRARGANVTDIVILVVAADDGIKAQTIEAINHATAAKVPIVVAINKIDHPEAKPDKIRQDLLNHGLVVEDLGGDILCVEVSAKQKINLDKLEEIILLQAEILELKANPDRAAQGVVIEAKLEKGRGPVATILVQNGTLKIGNIFIAGSEWGRVRALIDDRGKNVVSAGPSNPVEVLGFNAAPMAGDSFIVVKDETNAREIAEYRKRTMKNIRTSATGRQTLDELLSQSSKGEKKELAVVVKTDVQGSLEAILNSFNKLSTDEVAVRILHSGVGSITESDVVLANASKGMIIGFNVRANPQARELARRDSLPIRYYSIIYDVLDEIKAALSGMLAPTLREKYLGQAEIRQVFNVTKMGKIAGCMVNEGVVKRGARVRLLRDNIVIHEGTLKTLKRFKDEVKEVRESYECGMAFESYQDIREGDTIECFEIEEIARSL
ncbi:MAG: translation initiation factor IF-2 [Alphaproteobacteria bacterium]|nr:translation initiation factor IF-2 [Alphaproteobacteria bacterium]